MAEAVETSEPTRMNRRSFVKWAAAVGSLPVLGSLTACGSADEPGAGVPGQAAVEEDWRPYRCVTGNCAASCISYALVRDGEVIRVKTDDRNPDSWEAPQQRGCHRGQARKSIVFAQDRLKYPMKRKNWEVGGGKKELRGIDEWVKISWDEALDIISSELTRVIETYGNESIFRATQVGTYNILSALGGSMGTTCQGSMGGWTVPVNRMTGIVDIGVFGGGYGTTHLSNDRIDIMNSKLIIMEGNNPAWSSIGFPSYIFLEAKKRGAKIIAIDPFYNHSHSILADQWISIRPATDTALLLACAYVMIEGNLQDQDFLDIYTVGFDAGHMPEGADPQENFKDYVLGTYDGVAKTPEWASGICGVQPDVIRGLATDMATIKPAAFFSAGAPARAYRGEQYTQTFLTVGWMTGNVGKPGSQVADSYHIMMGNGGNPLVYAGGNGAPFIPDPIANTMMAVVGPMSPADGFLGMPCNTRWKSILSGEFNDGPRGTKKCDIKLIYDVGEGNNLNQFPDTFKGIEAYRTVEFVAAADSFFTPAVQYADVVLPVTMNWERFAQAGYLNNREVLTYSAQMVEPLFEAKDDWWINSELAKKLGIDPTTVAIEPNVAFYNQLAGAEVVKDDGIEVEPLFTITTEDLAELGVEGEPQEGRIPYQQFKKDGIYQVPRKEGDNFSFIALKDFIDDPVANPLNTESGKLQIYSKLLADHVAAWGSYTISPVAKYEPPQSGYEATFEDFAQRTPGKYPLQLVSTHYPGRMHSHFDNAPWLKEAFPHEAFVNPIDAGARGLAQGDGIKVFNDAGAVIRTVKLTSRITPGVIAVSEGGWVDKDEELGVDIGGCTNVLVAGELCGTDIQPWNTVNVQIEKWDKPVIPDAQRPLRIPVLEG